MQPDSFLSLFHPLVREWFAGHVGTPTDVQTQAWSAIAKGKHVLVTAPTGCGKTLAAFLYAIDRLVTGAWINGETRVLYVSPLRALNNDVRKNLLGPLAGIEAAFAEAGVPFPSVRVMTRSSDTEQSERRRMLRRPPEILITTPESLNILVTSRQGRDILGGLSTVILDEVHALAGGKRGTHLMTAVERLTLLSGEFQRIALSATVEPPEAVAAFVGGYRLGSDGGTATYEARKLEIIRSDAAKTYDLRVRFPAPEELPGASNTRPSGAAGMRHRANEEVNSNKSIDQEAAFPKAEGEDSSFLEALAGRLLPEIIARRSTLVFANSRRQSEKFARLLNEKAQENVAWPHHGSISRELRLAVEEKMKSGELPAIVATNSLELGIDIGALDSVELLSTPPSVASSIQRLGRAGHGVGEVSRGAIHPLHGLDLVKAAVTVKAVAERAVEPVRIVDCPLDVLAQVILAMTVPEEWSLDGLFDFIRTASPFHELPRTLFDLVIEMLAGRYAGTRMRELRPRLSVDRLEGKARAKDGAMYLLSVSGGTIPDRGYFDLRMEGSLAKIGELDEEFVWERQIGDTFALGAQVWKIRRIGAADVEVSPAEGRPGIIPFWRAEEMDRPFAFSERIGKFLAEAEAGLDNPAFREKLLAEFRMEETAADAMLSFLRLERDALSGKLPHRHRLVIERIEGAQGKQDALQCVLHTLWGGRVNRPFAFALSEAWEQKYGYPLETFATDDAILLMLPHDFGPEDALSLLAPDNVIPLLRKKLEKTGYFGARFRENGGRALLLPRPGIGRRMPLWINRLRAKKLMEAVLRFEDFPILLETWREILQDDYDLHSLNLVLSELRDGVIEVTEVVTKSPSPFCSGVVFQQTNKYMYEDDTPNAGKTSRLSDSLFRELMKGGNLRPRLPGEIVAALEAKLQRTAPGYTPDSGNELLDFLKERIAVPLSEWNALLAACVRDHGKEAALWEAAITTKTEILHENGMREALMAARENLPRLRKALMERGDESLLASLLCEWLTFYGPRSPDFAAKAFGLEKTRLESVLPGSVEEGILLFDRFTEGGEESEYCDTQNAERLYRMLRESRRESFPVQPLSRLPLFLANWQNLAPRGNGMEALRTSLEKLFGRPEIAGEWEESVLPARVEPYYPAWMDSLVQESGLAWFGCGDGKTAFAFPEDFRLYREKSSTVARDEAGKLIPGAFGKYGLFDIAKHRGLSTAETHEALWKLAWAGEVSCDSFAALRKGVERGFQPSRAEDSQALSRWARTRSLTGGWYLLPEVESIVDPLEAAELERERARALLQRFGVVFRDLSFPELPPLQWRRVFRALRLLELAGECVSGRFFDGAPGPQFALPQALRSLRTGLPADTAWFHSATDPASLCGIKFENAPWSLPRRAVGNWVAWLGETPVVSVLKGGKSLAFHLPPGDFRIPSASALFRTLLAREFRPLARLSVETVNNENAQRTPYAEDLSKLGFVPTHKGFELFRRY
jgi:ATP-dependent Lhr-like helicase